MNAALQVFTRRPEWGSLRRGHWSFRSDQSCVWCCPQCAAVREMQDPPMRDGTVAAELACGCGFRKHSFFDGY